MKTLKQLRQNLQDAEEGLRVAQESYRLDSDYRAAAKLFEIAKRNALSGIASTVSRAQVSLKHAREELQECVNQRRRKEIDIPDNVLRLFTALTHGVDWSTGGKPWPVHWVSQDGRFVVFSMPNGHVWSGQGMPWRYVKARHFLMDISKLGDNTGIEARNVCRIEECEGRLKKIKLEYWMRNAALLSDALNT